ncbi:serine O-acetyltransferase [Paenibacillus sp. 1001270B_150601_E10]|uniref:serine O-acetyltransferase n=1 Tax=Paenibacillus sp. 1001270B_150601_E10 TaxID=2787079 RepID=UPI00189E1776|nr:DapH/DapD/GlmU-related protein [Paenibacillus sp. 1001270B_150601_E10]
MHAVCRWHQRAKRLKQLRVPFLPKLITIFIRIVFACDLPIDADLGKDVKLFHNGLGVVIHRRARIGRGTSIYQNVTIGGNGRTGDANGVPIIGEHVFIGAGAVIMGPIMIGDHAKIGANSVVTRSVPAYGVAYGAPAQLVRTEQPGKEVVLS